MNIFESLSNMMAYLTEGVARIFSPSDDAYPMVGVNPFEGTPYKGSPWDE